LVLPVTGLSSCFGPINSNVFCTHGPNGQPRLGSPNTNVPAYGQMFICPDCAGGSSRKSAEVCYGPFNTQDPCPYGHRGVLNATTPLGRRVYQCPHCMLRNRPGVGGSSSGQVSEPCHGPINIPEPCPHGCSGIPNASTPSGRRVYQCPSCLSRNRVDRSVHSLSQASELCYGPFNTAEPCAHAARGVANATTPLGRRVYQCPGCALRNRMRPEMVTNSGSCMGIVVVGFLLVVALVALEHSS
jgi:Zn-finger protein